MNKKVINSITSFFLAITLIVSFAGCAGRNEKSKVRIGVMGASDTIIWQPVVDEFANRGIDIELVYFTDFSQPNEALSNGDIDLNAFQHRTFLNKQISKYGYKLSVIGDTMLQSLNLYSSKITNVSELSEGDKIAVPNDEVNFGRALTVLNAAGIIELDPNSGLTPEKSDIISNPLNLELVEVDASQTVSLLPDVSAAIINGNYALDAGLSPKEDSIFHDDVTYYVGNDYVNTIVARTEDVDNNLYKEIVKVYQSDRTKGIYANEFQGCYIPAWE